MYVKELETRINKNHKLSFVDQKASQPDALLNVHAKEGFFQLLPKEASLKLRKTSQHLRLIYKIAMIKYKFFLEKTT